jgi:prophage regulatory protein
MSNRTNENETSSSPVILKRREVQALVRLGKSTIYERIKIGTFPKQSKLEGSSVGWDKSEIEAWIAGVFTVGRGQSLPNSLEASRPHTNGQDVVSNYPTLVRWLAGVIPMLCDQIQLAADSPEASWARAHTTVQNGCNILPPLECMRGLAVQLSRPSMFRSSQWAVRES